MKKIASLFMATALTIFIAGCDNNSKNADASKSADIWPNKNITIIVPFNAGGDTDFHARNLSSHLEKELGVTVIVNNVSGANGNAGMRQVINAKPDGYTALFFHESMLTNKVVGLANQAHEALSPIAATIVDDSYVIAVNANSNMKNLDDLVAEAKKRPGELIYASSVGGYSYYLGRVFEQLAGVDFNIVDAGGGTDRNAALLAGKIDINVNPYGVMKSYFDSGDFIPLAVINENRNKLFPDVLTAKEQGYDWLAERYYFLSFPKGADNEIVTKMAAAIKKVTEQPDFQKKTEDAYSVSPTFVGTQDLIKHLDSTLQTFEENKDLVNN
ncbi:Tripartite-type tricarboxylate transporter, receptor component TctC [Pasteurella testudinis DSM 23072]|uniref:Tripartite-type tricarboxylate transporter, receptor component TctC n=1 Tax=Pasteurella testudinis DSM 23072 TaxID=1122938 RepID=A0A1W1V0J5_9PAST|nr:tripartite tricarboxylate transporter substrate binding protein [Pasteurella testudinis]SMB86820.1 Tripartite-type tricarboxylate transporter, receptor component TctC [Pasteurella testudinis DSM 23072]SUB50374.1 tripartite tricarboxylate transporter family receptor [Pasteurella testudinis]